LAGAGLLVFSNKTDVNDCMTNDEIRMVTSNATVMRCTLLTFYEALELDAIHTHKWVIISCSAITGDNLEQGLEWVIQQGRDSLFLY
jgi:ADP-ribosylation factor-like protein 2